MENKEPKPIHQQIIDLVGGEDKFREIAGLKRKNNKTMENKQTAVEWLYSQISFNGLDDPNGEVLEQAKAMEKEQITEAHLQGLYIMILK